MIFWAIQVSCYLTNRASDGRMNTQRAYYGDSIYHNESKSNCVLHEIPSKYIRMPDRHNAAVSHRKFCLFQLDSRSTICRGEIRHFFQVFFLWFEGLNVHGKRGPWIGTEGHDWGHYTYIWEEGNCEEF